MKTCANCKRCLPKTHDFRGDYWPRLCGEGATDAADREPACNGWKPKQYVQLEMSF